MRLPASARRGVGGPERAGIRRGIANSPTQAPRHDDPLDAIEQQLRTIEWAKQQCDQKRHVWYLARSKTKAIDKAVERFRIEEQLRVAKREQKENDEFAQRRVRAQRDRDES